MLYRFKIRHDQGECTLRLQAENLHEAVLRVKRVEGCPERAIKSITITKEKGEK